MKQIGQPISAALDAVALVVALLGGARYFRQQALLMRERWIAGGVDLLVIFALFMLVSHSLEFDRLSGGLTRTKASLVLFVTFLAI